MITATPGDIEAAAMLAVLAFVVAAWAGVGLAAATVGAVGRVPGFRAFKRSRRMKMQAACLGPFTLLVLASELALPAARRRAACVAARPCGIVPAGKDGTRG